MSTRADIALVTRGLVADRDRARRLIMAGRVRRGADHVVKKPNEEIPDAAPLSVDERCPYVSRGAYKLLPALERWLPCVDGMTALDIGASTGGFTDLLLQRGARRVYAVDAGHGQLHYRLRQDPRVICLEKVNARRLDASHISEPVDLITADVSFISLRYAADVSRRSLLLRRRRLAGSVSTSFPRP